MKKVLMPFALVVFVCNMAQAGVVQCDKREKVLKMLQEQFGETLESTGTTGTTVIETWVSKETGTWTITFSEQEHTICLLASGEGYRETTE